MSKIIQALKNTGVGAAILGAFLAVVLAWNYIAGAFSNSVGLTEFWSTAVYMSPFVLYIMYVVGGMYITLYRK